MNILIERYLYQSAFQILQQSQNRQLTSKSAEMYARNPIGGLFHKLFECFH